MKRTRLIKGFPGPMPDAAAVPAQGMTVRPAKEPPPSMRPEAGHPNPDDEVLFHLSGLLDSVKTGMISLDGEGRVRVFNAEAEALFGVPRQLVLGKPFSSAGRTLPLRDNGTRDLWGRLSDAIWAAGAALDLEYDLFLSDGRKRIIAYSVYPLGRLAWSVGNGVVLMLEDITRKKELEEQIHDSGKRLQAVFDGITDGIQVVDAEFRITAVNKSMTGIIGGPVAVGQRCYHACLARIAVCDGCPAVETFRTGQPSSLIRRIPRDGTAPGGTGEQVLEISTFPLLERGSLVLHVVEYIKDVTERVGLAERLEHARRLSVLGEMAARVAHEVRNPLNAITGAAHYLAAEYPGDETIQKFTSLIKRQSLRVDQVASDILHAARPLRLNRTTVNIDAVIEQAITGLRGSIEDLGITVEHIRAPGGAMVQADELQIDQALSNVLRNAVEAMPEGGALTVRTTWDRGNDRLLVSVQDTGSGIPAQDRDRIFQAFYTTKAQGTGLGLSIVEGVLKNHGGAIAVEQPATGGTRIVLSFPARGDAGEPDTRSTRSVPPGPAVPESAEAPRSRRRGP